MLVYEEREHGGAVAWAHYLASRQEIRGLPPECFMFGHEGLIGSVQTN